MKNSSLTIVSLAYGTILLVLSGWWLFNIVRTPYNRCLSVLWLPLLLLIFVSSSRSTSDQNRESAPLKINLIVLAWLVTLVIFRAYWDLDFILHGKEYLSAVQSMNINQLNLSPENDRGVHLPLEYRHLSVFEKVYVTLDEDLETVLFVFPNTPDDLDGLLNAYIYVHGKMPADLPEKCLSGRPVSPHYENWYYCVVSLNQAR
jgi:hypothetical protein